MERSVTDLPEALAIIPDPLRRRPLLRAVRNWRERHQNRFNFWIHLIGIPLALLGVVLLGLAEWAWGAAALGAGYFLQYVGHCVEGNDVGEWAAIKKWLGLPYIAIAIPTHSAKTAANVEQGHYENP